MKTFKLIVIFIFTVTQAFSQAPVPEWATKIGSDMNDVIQAIDTDPMGNVYVAGKFSSSTLTIGSTTLTNPQNGSFHAFIAKYDSNGNLLWARSGGSVTQDDNIVALDAAQTGVVVGANFNGGNITFESTTLNPVGGSDFYVVMYDANGNLQWLKVFGGTSNDYLRGVCFDLNTDVFITGGFTNSINFGANVHNAVSAQDIFVAALYNSNGNVIWSKSYGGSGGTLSEDGTAIAADQQNVYIAGRFNSNKISFAPGDTLINSVSVDEMFVLKLNNSNGNTIWSRRAGGICNEWPKAIDLDNAVNNGNIYISGYYSCTAHFGTDSVTATGYTGGFSTNSDAFVCKMDNSGNFLWVKNFGGNSYDDSFDCSVDNNGNVTVIVNCVNCSGLSFASQTLPSFGNQDIYVLQYNQNGNEMWGLSYGTSGYESIYACASNKSNNYPIYIGGTFESNSITFGTHTLSSSVVSADGFVVKLAANTNGINNINKNDITIYPNPATQQLNLQINQTGIIEIYSLEGKLLQRLNANTSHATIEISAYAKGMYLLRFTGNDGSMYQQKFIKE